MKVPITLLLTSSGASDLFLIFLAMRLSEYFKCLPSIRSLDDRRNFTPYKEKVKVSFCTFQSLSLDMTRKDDNSKQSERADLSA
jgi:hypothetical protein